MRLPPKLKDGDVVGVIAPSGSFERERLAPGLAYLRKRGFLVREGDSLYAQDRYLAGTDVERAADVNAMFADPVVKAIFVARGGYGSARVLDLLDWEMIGNNPKALVGLSDTTALQLGLFAKVGVVSFSGLALCSDVTEEGINAETEEALWAAVCEHRFEAIGGLTVLRDGEVQGPLVGGCLSLVVSLVGTGFFPDIEGTVLVLEDVNEPPYRVDRMLNQLKMVGVFDRVACVVFGQFVGCEPERKAEGTLEDVLNDFAQQMACPIFAGLPYGHGDGRRVMPVGLGVRVGKGGLVFDEVFDTSPIGKERIL